MASPILPKSSFVTLKNKVITERIGKSLINGKEIPIFQIKVCSQTKINGSLEKCGIHALKNAIIALGLIENKLFKLDFISKKYCQDFIKYFDLIAKPNDNDISNYDIKYFLNKICNQQDNSQIYSQIIKKYRSHITIMQYNNQNEALAGCLGDISLLDNFYDISSFIELNKKLKGNDPFHHVFIAGTLVMSQQGHWLTLVLERDASGNYSWYGMDSWKNETQLIVKIISTISTILQEMDSSLREEKFLKKWYNNILSALVVTKRSDFKYEWLLDNPSYYLGYVASALEFMEKAGWLIDDKFQDEKNLLIKIVTYYHDNGLSNHPIVVDSLRRLNNASSKADVILIKDN